MLFGIDLGSFLFTAGILALCGAVGGFLAGLLGIGGGMIFVPVFYFIFINVFHVSPDIAMILSTGTSLACMIPTSITAALAQYRRGNTDLEVIRTWSAGMIAGVIVGALISSFYGGVWLAVLFGVIMILNSLNTFFRANAKPMYDSLPGKTGQRIIGFGIACFSVMLGVGGGTLTVPVLNACSTPPHKSVGTSSAVSLFVCIPGALILFTTGTTPENAPALTFGYVSFLAVMCVVPVSVLCAPFGVKTGKLLSPAALKRIFSVFLFIVALRMLLSAFE